MTNSSSLTPLAFSMCSRLFASAIALCIGACTYTGSNVMRNQSWTVAGRRVATEGITTSRAQLYTAGASNHITGAPVQSGQSLTQTDSPAVKTTIPGIPNLPDVVTVVPFYWKANETEGEQTKVVIPAEVDGLHSIFIVDIGCPPLMLNRTFLQPSATGGVDSVTDANRIPDHSEENKVNTFDKVHVTMRIGTLLVKFEDPTLARLPDTAKKGPYNALLGHEWGNFGWNFSPRLGNIGLSVLEQFETIIDYTHRRFILIRLDSAGHRLANVPAYTPKSSFPLIDLPRKYGMTWWGIAARQDGTLDTLNTSNNVKTFTIDTGAPSDDDTTLGYTFLSNFGVIGFNHRMHQFILYR